MDCGGKPRASSASSASARPQPAAAGASSLSLSLEDELATAIHGALRGAVEVAVLEVSRLVGQALGGARRQMRGTLQENRSLKERLLVAERELDALRGARRPGSPRGSVRAGVSFGETCEDGQVRSRRWTRGPPAAEEDRVNVYGGSRPVGMEFDGERTEAAATTSPGPDIKRVRVKEEESEAAGGSRPASGADPVAGHKFEADCPPRARSKLLRDRRPEPSEESDSDSFALSDPSVFSSATVRSNGLVPAAGGFSLVAVPFPNPFRSGDAESATPSQQPCSLRAGSSGSIGSSTPRMHICGDCGVVFQQLAELRRHCQQHSGARPRRAKRPALAPGCSPYRCSHCGRDFNRLENLKTHLRIHTGERPYSCLVCGVRFRHSGALTRHFRIHTGEKPYVCSRCGRAFRNCGGLRFHQQSHVREGQSAAD